MTPWKGTQKDDTSPPQWDGFLYVLSASDARSLSLSLDYAENPDKIELKGSSKEKVEKNMTMMEDKSQTKSIDQNVIKKVTKGSD